MTVEHELIRIISHVRKDLQINDAQNFLLNRFCITFASHCFVPFTRKMLMCFECIEGCIHLLIKCVCIVRCCDVSTYLMVNWTCRTWSNEHKSTSNNAQWTPHRSDFIYSSIRTIISLKTHVKISWNSGKTCQYKTHVFQQEILVTMRLRLIKHVFICVGRPGDYRELLSDADKARPESMAVSAQIMELKQRGSFSHSGSVSQPGQRSSERSPVLVWLTCWIRKKTCAAQL